MIAIVKSDFNTEITGLLLQGCEEQLNSLGIDFKTFTCPGAVETVAYSKFLIDKNQFDAIIGGAEVTKGKPDPEIYIKVAALVGVAPSDCWVIEDSLQGIASGLAAGARVVGITTSHTAEELAHTQVIAPNFIDLFAKIADL
jgi:beta-phosphoglucomutase-like phosphatase (HAD superfamily)